MVAKNCDWCGTEFNARDGSKTCSEGCRIARRARMSLEYYEANRENDRRRRREQYLANKDDIIAYQREYRKANRAKLSAYDRARREANPERAAAYQRGYRLANRVKLRAQKSEYHAANKDAIRARNRARRERAMASAGCSVYVVHAAEASAHKIGLAVSPKSRLSAMQVACPDPLTMPRVFKFADKPTALKVERRAHEILAEHHSRGEWFKTDLQTVLAAIETAIAETGAIQADERKLQDAAKVYDRIAA